MAIQWSIGFRVYWPMVHRTLGLVGSTDGRFDSTAAVTIVDGRTGAERKVVARRVAAFDAFAVRQRRPPVAEQLECIGRPACR